MMRAAVSYIHQVIKPGTEVFDPQSVVVRNSLLEWTVAHLVIDGGERPHRSGFEGEPARRKRVGILQTETFDGIIVCAFHFRTETAQDVHVLPLVPEPVRVHEPVSCLRPGRGVSDTGAHTDFHLFHFVENQFTKPAVKPIEGIGILKACPLSELVRLPVKHQRHHVGLQPGIAHIVENAQCSPLIVDYQSLVSEQFYLLLEIQSSSVEFRFILHLSKLFLPVGF